VRAFSLPPFASRKRARRKGWGTHILVYPSRESILVPTFRGREKVGHPHFHGVNVGGGTPPSQPAGRRRSQSRAALEGERATTSLRAVARRRRYLRDAYFFVGAVDLAQCVADLAYRGVGADAVHYEGHGVGVGDVAVFPRYWLAGGGFL
jgi:hypothetical protein